MPTLTETFSSKSNITVTVASLSFGNARASTVVDNTTNLYLDALVAGYIKGGATSTATTGTVNIYAYASVDGGTTYSDAATGSDAAHTINKNAPLLGVVALDANAEMAKFGPFSVASAFGGVLPPKWGVIVENKTGGALDSTGGNHEIHYVGVKLSSA